MKKYYENISPNKLKEHSSKISKINKGNPKMCGENNGNSKLLKNDVVNIRKFYENNKTNGHTKTIKNIMHKYNLAYSTIDSIVKRKTWKNVD